jgi:hypothetical protein
MWERWKLGAKALEVARWAGDIARNLDPSAVLALVFKVIEIERTMRGIPGADKLRALLDWLRSAYPGMAGNASVANFVSALVALLNALAIFRK